MTAAAESRRPSWARRTAAGDESSVRLTVWQAVNGQVWLLAGYEKILVQRAVDGWMIWQTDRAAVGLGEWRCVLSSQIEDSDSDTVQQGPNSEELWSK
jgi:hypothetical protein